MAQPNIRLAWGDDAKIKGALGINGRMYVSKDKHKLYLDTANNKRIELNQGIIIKDLIITQETMEIANLPSAIDLSSNELCILVMGTNENYYKYNINCISSNKSTLTFSWDGDFTQEIEKPKADIFIYQASTLDNWEFNVVPKEEQPEETAVYTLRSGNWVDDNGDGIYTQTLSANISDGNMIMLTSEDSAFSILGNTDFVDGAIIVNSQYLPEKDIEVYIHQIEGASINNTVIDINNWIEGVNIVEVDGITTDSLVIIQALTNTKEYVLIKEAICGDNIIAFYGEGITDNIEIQITNITEATIPNEVIIDTTDWTINNIGQYVKTIILTEALQCGPDGTLPPLIVCSSNKTDYAAITDIIISGSDTRAITIISNNIPNNDITIQILDFIK